MKKNLIFKGFLSFAPIAAFVAFALAATSCDILDDPDFKEGFKNGWNYATKKDVNTDFVLEDSVPAVSDEEPTMDE